MGWNSSVVLVKNRTAAQVAKALPDVFAVTDEVVGGEVALSSQLDPNAALGEIPGWVALWTSNVQLVMGEEFLEEVSRGGTQAVVCLQSSVSTIHGFMVYENGKPRRILIREHYEPVVDDGDPLPEESALSWEDDEGCVFEVVRALTGVDVADSRTWQGVKFRLVTVDP